MTQIIYILPQVEEILINKNYKYDLIQTLEKSQDKRGGEINKVIILSNKLLVSDDHRSITIWSEKNPDENKRYYEDLFEIIINLLSIIIYLKNMRKFFVQK